MPEDKRPEYAELSAIDFVAHLEQSGVLSESGAMMVRECVEGQPDDIDAKDLARRLVERGCLTEFQANRALVGRSRGLVFGRYVLLDRIGAGAMGRVFKARHQLMDRLVAIKVVQSAHADAQEALFTRFFREMKIVGMLDHPNVVRAFDADQHLNAPFIVMEFLEGEDLEKVLRRKGVLRPVEVMVYALQAAWGLAHAHERGVVHRDIKPTNLFLTSEGIVKVLDLGLGAFVGVQSGSEAARDTDEGFIVGTSDYISPEQLEGQPVDARADLFGLGCSLYRILTGTYAFPGVTKMDRLVRRLNMPHIPITEVRGDIPVPMASIIDRLLHLDPERRFSTASEVAEEIEPLIPFSERPRQFERTMPAASSSKRWRLPDENASHRQETPVDWALIEHALGDQHGHADADTDDGTNNANNGIAHAEPLFSLDLPPVDSSVQPSPSLDFHRKNLEENGVESGRVVQQEYRKQVTELEKSTAVARADSRPELPVQPVGSWAERYGEKLGDLLAEPSVGLIAVVIFLILFILAGALAYSLV